MDSFQDKLKEIRAFIFDVDGVLSPDSTPLDMFGDPVRTSNVKDGFAIRAALRKGFDIAIITGGCQERVRLRYRKLGVVHYYDNVSDKLNCLNDYLKETGIDPGTILYMGDDIIDFQVMQTVGLPVCPFDASAEIREIAKYISGFKGGDGCVRDVIEKVLKAQNKWIITEMYNQHTI
jgi:3-deoxy-D-manno-octulosonate 8-phosphate phosphatase (KDO 8-P phosphatase)